MREQIIRERGGDSCEVERWLLGFPWQLVGLPWQLVGFPWQLVRFFLAVGKGLETLGIQSAYCKNKIYNTVVMDQSSLVRSTRVLCMAVLYLPEGRASFCEAGLCRYSVFPLEEKQAACLLSFNTSFHAKKVWAVASGELYCAIHCTALKLPYHSKMCFTRLDCTSLHCMTLHCV